MSVLKCKMCGGSLEITEDMKICECEYCGTTQTVPSLKDENIQALFNRANTLRMKSEFDKAEQLYEKIIRNEPDEPEAHWGIILCKFGIEYVEDPATFDRVPTCHRTSFDSVMADEDYKEALRCADSLQRRIYESEAKEIDSIQKEIIALSKKEDPYDVFICYKESDNGTRTPDSVIANDIYHQLTNEGFKVFFAAISLESKLGSAYEPCIFAALNSAKVMLAIGTKPEYFTSAWVKNEWSRYLGMMRKDSSKLLIPCYKNMDAYELPDEFAHLQAQDMSKIGFINDIVRGIRKVIGKDEPKPAATAVVSVPNANVSALLRRVFIFLEDGDWKSADEYCERVLDLDPENGEAYLGKLMAEMKVSDRYALNVMSAQIKGNKNYKKIMRFGSDALKSEINNILTALYYIDKNNIDDAADFIKKHSIEVISIGNSVTSIGRWAFYGCEKLKSFNVNSGNPKYSSIDGVLFDKDKSTLIKYPCGKNETEYIIPDSVKKIECDAFDECKSLKSVTIGNSVKNIKYVDFDCCKNLKTFTVNSGNSEYSSVDGVLFDKDKSTLIKYPCGKNETKYIIPDSVKDIDLRAFDGCKSLKIFTVNSGNSEYSSVDGVLFDKNKSTLIKYPCGKKETKYIIPNSVKTIEDRAFDGCKNLKSVTIGNSVTSIGDDAFEGCESLESVTIGNSVTSIGNWAFEGCESLESVTIGNSVTSIGDCAFWGCESLTSINIPDSVTSIGDSAFSRCESLESVTIPDSVTSIGYRAFCDCESLTIKGKKGSYAETYADKEDIPFRAI